MVYGCFANKVLGLCFCFIGVQVTNWVHLHQNDYFLADAYCWFWILHLWFQNVRFMLEFFHCRVQDFKTWKIYSLKKQCDLHAWFIFKSRFNCHSYSKCYSILRWDKILVIIVMSLLKSFNYCNGCNQWVLFQSIFYFCGSCSRVGGIYKQK